MKARATWRKLLLVACLFVLPLLYPAHTRADILWRNTSNGMNAVWYMNGTTITSVALLPTGDPAWKVVAFLPTVISGTVKAPGGTVAFYLQPSFLERIAKFFSSSAAICYEESLPDHDDCHWRREPRRRQSQRLRSEG